MSTKKQHELILSRLTRSACEVGIDLEKSGCGLMEICSHISGLGMEFMPEDVAEAGSLWREFGASDEGADMLYALGEACMYADGWTWMPWDFEPAWESEEELKAAGWSDLEERCICDFAMYTGIASAACHLYSNMKFGQKKNSLFSLMGKKGAHRRHAPMADLRAWAIAKYRAGSWQSANQAAHALRESVIEHGRTINAHLTEENAQRTIAEWFRKSA